MTDSDVYRGSSPEEYTGVLDYFFGEGADLSIVERAALYVQFAKDGFQSSFVDFKPSTLARNCYDYRYKVRFIFFVLALIF